MIFNWVLGSLIRRGTMRIVQPNGETVEFGGTEPGHNVTVRIHDPAFARKLLMSPSMAFGEGYMEGAYTVDNDDLDALVALVLDNIMLAPPSPLAPVTRFIGQRLQQFNPRARARRNVAHHYDLSEQLYRLFLDRDLQYSCAYFQRPDDDLETAQEAKKRHIAAKLRLAPGLKVLDIGSGWGGLALWLARETGADVTGLTLSVEQHRVATERARAAGLEQSVRFHLRDYREERGTYDRIVSVGMFEHVGAVHYPEFFRRVAALLAPDGVGLLHSIGRADGPGTTNGWLRKYIFPGGYCPALSEVLPPVERAGLWVTDIEILRLHYATTLSHWRRRFAANREAAKALYDERFCRMWELYLTACEWSFRVQGMQVFQMQLTRAVDSVPITRDYMLDWERAQQGTEAAVRVA